MTGTEGRKRSDVPPAGNEAQGNICSGIVEALDSPAVVLDSVGAVVSYNGGAKDMFPPIQARQNLSLATRNPDLLRVVETALLRKAEHRVQFVDRIPFERQVSARIVPLKGIAPGPGQAAMLLTFRDMTEQHRLDQMRSDFVANASHELRTPLASLSGYIETLQTSAKHDEEARERFLKIMSDQAQRMSRLIDDLLSLSRVEMRAHLPPRGEVDLNEVLQVAQDAILPVAEKIGTKIELIKRDGLALVRGDRDEIVQVFQNLVQNAVKYGKADGLVKVEIKRVPVRVSIPRASLRVQRPAAPPAAARFEVSVTDDGPGIAQIHLPRLVERFYRVSVASSREKGGTGLGLAIVKHILTRHGGSLKIDSELGKGSTFTVLLDEQAHRTTR